MSKLATHEVVIRKAYGGERREQYLISIGGPVALPRVVAAVHCQVVNLQRQK